MEIAVDTGNKQIKTKHETFVSGIVEETTEPGIANADYMRMNGKFFVLKNERNTYIRDKTRDDRYYHLTVMAIVKELEHMTERTNVDKSFIHQITLLVGLPPLHYGDLKDSFQSYFKKGEPVKVQYRGRNWYFKINRVMVYTQGYAAIAPFISEIKKYPKAMVWDIGGMTADYVAINYGIANTSVTDSLESGVISLYRKIKRLCQSKHDVLIEENDVDAILLGSDDTVSLYPLEVISTVREQTRKFVDELLESFSEIQIDLKTTYIIFVGGGALLLRKFIEESNIIKNYKFVEDVNANVTGYELLYKVMQLKGKK